METEVKEPAVSYGKQRWSEDEYLEMERAALDKHEYYQGEIFAMAGAGKKHNIIAVNILSELAVKLRGNGCRPFGSDARMHIPQNTLYTYPDIAVYCNNESNENEDNFTAPVIIIEILSPSTEGYDRGQKFELYKAIPSLQEYILVSSKTILVEAFRRNEQNTWQTEMYNQPQQTLTLQFVALSISLQDIYADTNF